MLGVIYCAETSSTSVQCVHDPHAADTPPGRLLLNNVALSSDDPSSELLVGALELLALSANLLLLHLYPHKCRTCLLTLAAPLPPSPAQAHSC
jgi:hypothetical protein